MENSLKNIIWFGLILIAAGATYGMGRKYGRIICEKLDTFEDRLTTMLSTATSE